MFGGLREDGDSRRWVAGRPMSGRWGDGVGWFVGLGDCRGLRVALSWSGGSLVGGGGGCVSVRPGVGPAAGAIVPFHLVGLEPTAAGREAGTWV